MAEHIGRYDGRFDAVRDAGGERYAAFIRCGFRECWVETSFSRTQLLLQKPVVKGGVRLFFINVWVYDRRDWGGFEPVAYQPEAQFNTHVGQTPTFDVTLHLPDGWGPGEVEGWFLALYERMGCGPYDD